MPELQPTTASNSIDPPSSSASGRDDAGGTEALAHLAKMSGTGSTFGAADYVAISPLAVASFIIGLAGALSLLINVFLFLPVVGIGCGLLAIRKIRHSNGTQAGYAFAVGGVLISLLIGGVVGAREVNNWMTVRRQTHEVADLVSQFGQEIAAGHYAKAYDKMTSDDFRSRVDLETFKKTFEELQHVAGYGRIESIEWNHEGMLIENVEDVETRALFLAQIKCQDMKEPGREYFRVSNKDGPWRISSIPRLFPEKKPGRNSSGAM